MRTILVSAYACEPLKGSEQGVGWNWVLQMAKTNKVHVITRANNQEPIEEHLPQELAANITWHYYDTPRFFRSFKKRAKGLYLYYFFWQIGIVPMIRGLSKEHNFDYSMHLTFGSLWMPTFLPYFKIPFIWGPIGGGDSEPVTYLKQFPLKTRFLGYLRFVMNKTIILNPFILFRAFRAKTILYRTDTSGGSLYKVFRNKSKVVLETAMEGEIFNWQKRNEPLNKNLKLITTGRLMPSKNIISVIKALHHLPVKYNIELKIIGSGPEKQKIEHYIKVKKLTHRVQIIPELTRTEVLSHLEESDIYVFPSLREGGSWALMEAMAIGLPVICLNWSGMKVTTDDQCAIRLPVSNPKQMPHDLADAICKLAEDKELREKMGLAGRERIRKQFNWDSKGRFLEELFGELDRAKMH